MSDLELRQALPGDEPALAALAAETFPLACPPGTDPGDIAAFVAANLSEEAFRAKLADPGWFCALALRDGQAAGYTLLGFGPNADDGTGADGRDPGACLLSKCYVLPGEQGSGAAGELLGFTLEEAARRGAPACWLGVNRSNARAQRFYAKHGFAIVGERTFVVGRERHLDDVMQTRLPALPKVGE